MKGLAMFTLSASSKYPLRHEHSHCSCRRGGTLIATDVVNMAMHTKRVCDADGYRPNRCPHCGHTRMHVHSYRERVLRADPETPTIRLVRYRCAHCRAIWRMLPMFVARFLWRRWLVVENATQDCVPPGCHPPVPVRTVQRWISRITAHAKPIIDVIMAYDDMLWNTIKIDLTEGCRRIDVIRAYTQRVKSISGSMLSDLAALLHGMAPGTRLI